MQEARGELNRTQQAAHTEIMQKESKLQHLQAECEMLGKQVNHSCCHVLKWKQFPQALGE
jgi:hypothetical protein